VATWTKAQLRDKILEHIGIKPAEQAANAADAVLVEGAIDSAYDQLRAMPPNLCPYSLSVIPEWAQPLLRDYVEPEIKPHFGQPVSPREKQDAQWVAKAGMIEQLALSKPNLPSTPEYF